MSEPHFTHGVSVIVPAYNAATTIEETIRSLQNQTYSTWEAIVIDDGSSDQTVKLVTQWIAREERLHLLRQEHDRQGSARNKGIEQAKYEWLLFLDADDWIDARHMELLIKKLSENTNLGAAYCSSARVSADGTVVAEKYLPPEGDLFPVLARRAAFPSHACIVSKAIVQAVGKFDRSLEKSEDWDLWQRVARTGIRFGAVSDCLAFYRMSPRASSLDNAESQLRDGLKILNQGHAPDPRVPNPHPDHKEGEPPDGVRTQQFYLLAWCAGLLLGSGKDARPLLTMLKDQTFPELYPEAVAQCIFDSAPLPGCKSPKQWEELAHQILENADEFLSALEQHSQAPRLAHLARIALRKMILSHSCLWSAVIEEYDQNLRNYKQWMAEQITEYERAQQELTERHNSEVQQKIAVMMEQITEYERLQQELTERHNSEVQQKNAVMAELSEKIRLLDDAAGEMTRMNTTIEQLNQDRYHWQSLAGQHKQTARRLKRSMWVRFGRRLGFIKI